MYSRPTLTPNLGFGQNLPWTFVSIVNFVNLAKTHTDIGALTCLSGGPMDARKLYDKIIHGFSTTAMGISLEIHCTMAGMKKSVIG